MVYMFLSNNPSSGEYKFVEFALSNMKTACGFDQFYNMAVYPSKVRHHVIKAILTQSIIFKKTITFIILSNCIK